jgi:hypothetical protein
VITAVEQTPEMPTRTSGSVTVTITANDNGGSGITGLAYSFDEGQTRTGNNEASFTGNQEVKVWVRDAVGNIATESKTIGNIDKASPSYSYIVTPAGRTGGNKTITITAHDEGVAGLASQAYYFNGSWQTSESRTTVNNGEYEIRVQDKVGNRTGEIVTVT